LEEEEGKVTLVKGTLLTLFEGKGGGTVVKGALFTLCEEKTGGGKKYC
jgi:hypothetical protein